MSQKSGNAIFSKACCQYLIDTHRLSERVACKLACLGRTAFRYCPKTPSDIGLRERLKELAAQYSRYGYLMLHGLLKAEGLVVNKKRKKLNRPRLVMVLPTRANQRWSMDFVSDQLSNGRRFRILNIVDDFSREVIGNWCPCQSVISRLLDF